MPVVTSFTSVGPLGDAAQDYNIEIVFEGMFVDDDGNITDPGPWTEALQAAFTSAANFLSSIVIGDLADVVTANGLVDDLRISATLEPIDGPFGVLGSAGPTLLRGGNSLPIEGEMTFDIADANALNVTNPDGSNPWEMTVVHEMLHVLGIGTLWQTLGLIDADTFRYLGVNGNHEWEFLFSSAYAADPDAALGAPIENDGGSGTALGHWEEDVFGNELMTGFIDTSQNNPLTNISIAALADLGYTTTYVASPCFLTGTRILTADGPRPVEELVPGDLLRTEDGRLTRALWIGHRRIDGRLAPQVWRSVVEITPGALGGGLPSARLFVTADHALMLDGYLVQAGALVNGDAIRWADPAGLATGYTVWHVETEGHEIILAEGAAAESYIDYIGRLAFDNAAEFDPPPGHGAHRPEHGAPRITTARHLPPALHARLRIARAA
jgi:hypothetical protein